MDIQLILDLGETPGLGGSRRSEVAKLVRQYNGRSVRLNVDSAAKVGDISIDHAILQPFPEAEHDNIMYVRTKIGQKEVDLTKTFGENGIRQGAMLRVYALIK